MIAVMALTVLVVFLGLHMDHRLLALLFIAVATLLAVFAAVIIARTILALATTRLETCSKAFGTEAATIVAIVICRIGSLRMNTWTLRTSSAIVA